MRLNWRSSLAPFEFVEAITSATKRELVVAGLHNTELYVEINQNENQES